MHTNIISYISYFTNHISYIIYYTLILYYIHANSLWVYTHTFKISTANSKKLQKKQKNETKTPKLCVFLDVCFYSCLHFVWFFFSVFLHFPRAYRGLPDCTFQMHVVYFFKFRNLIDKTKSHRTQESRGYPLQHPDAQKRWRNRHRCERNRQLLKWVSMGHGMFWQSRGTHPCCCLPPFVYTLEYANHKILT